MEIHFAPEIEAELRVMAARQGKQLPQVVEETVTRAWQLLHEQEAWLTEHRSAIDAQIGTGLAELERGEGIPADQLDAYLAQLEALPE